LEEKNIIESLRSLHDLSKAINSTLNIDEVVAMILEKTAKLMKAARVLILLLDREKKELTVHSSLGFREDELPVRQFRNIRSFDHCIVHKGTVISMDEVLPAEKYQELSALMPGLMEMFFAPLEIKGEAYGLLGVSGEQRNFSQVELEIFCSLGSQAAVAMENANLYKKLRAAFLHTAEALAEAIDSRDSYTGGHTRRVQKYSLLLAHSLGLKITEQEALRLAAILHDIGKIGIDDAILRKKGSLSEEEKAAMKTHPDIGAKILAHVEEMRDVIPGVRHHHEWFDGSGYPDGLKGEEIPIHARIISIVDAFDALTTGRPYRKALTETTALSEMEKGSGSHFDPDLLKIFEKALQGSDTLQGALYIT